MSDMSKEPMVGKEAAKTLRINDRLNALLIDVNGNLKCIDEINGILLGASNVCKESEGERKSPNGWFDNIIDMLISLHEANVEMKEKLVRLHREVIDK